MPIITIAGLILAAIAASQIATAVYVVFLAFTEILDWFRSNRQLAEGDRREIAFTLQKRLADNNYETVQGVFNKQSKTLGKTRSVTSSNIDSELRNYHRNKDLVIYE